jgi:hypothetical protein
MVKLLEWLEATGEFSQEVRRLRRWQAYLTGLPQAEASKVLVNAVTLAAWFDVRSTEALGKYTPDVERYLNEVRPGRYWHEDVIFCGRRRIEYHMNMVGAEIMNRVFREGFIRTSSKIVFLPGCLRLLPEEKCRAAVSGEGLYCTGCTAGCSVSKITALGRRHGFKAFIIPHESSISSGKYGKQTFDKDTGVIGIACVLNLIAGGWMLKEMGIPAQCVLLDYCGCKNHWSREGIPTEIHIGKLLEIMGIGREEIR